MILVDFQMRSTLLSSLWSIGLRIRKAFSIRFAWFVLLCHSWLTSILSVFQKKKTRVSMAPKIRTKLSPQKIVTPWYIITRSEHLNVRKFCFSMPSNNIYFHSRRHFGLPGQRKSSVDVQRRCDRGWQIPSDVHQQRLLKSKIYPTSYPSTHVVPAKSLMDCQLRQEHHWPKYQMDKISW